jgi:mycofactocin precursor
MCEVAMDEEREVMETKAEEQAPVILDEVCIEEMAVDGICGIY